MSRFYSDEFENSVLSARAAGMPFREIRKKFRIGDQTVRLWLREISLNTDCKIKRYPEERRGRFSDKDRREVVKLYQAGHSIADICKSVQIGRSTLYRWISLHTGFRRYVGEVFTSKEIYSLREENRMSALLPSLHPEELLLVLPADRHLFSQLSQRDRSLQGPGGDCRLSLPE